MTIDIEELKAFALACDPSKCADEAEEGLRLAEFYSECTPEDVLALLAEIERLAKFEDWFVRLDQVEQSLAASFKAERDQLKAENEALIQSRDRAAKLVDQLEVQHAELKAALETLERDAKRYRWLRQGENYAHQYLVDLGMENLEGFDRSIDAAMAKEAK